ncbi:MAG: DNA-binding protein [Candidatus Altiarchaeales archaeon]|nr:MAG: DNA-binding protein [Candidatus Altiarchaeales archaeon]
MDDELEKLRRERLRQLMEQQRLAQEQQLQQQIEQIREAAEIEAQIKSIIDRILTPKAKERLSNLRVVRPAFVRQIELFLIQLYQTGRLPNRITDEQLKDILRKISGRKREIKIKRI